MKSTPIVYCSQLWNAENIIFLPTHQQGNEKYSDLALWSITGGQVKNKSFIPLLDKNELNKYIVSIHSHAVFYVFIYMYLFASPPSLHPPKNPWVITI